MAKTPDPQSPQAPVTSEQRLELGELLFFPNCPFSLPLDGDRELLFAQRQNPLHKNITYNPHNGRMSGWCPQAPEQAEKVATILQAFGEQATGWLGQLLPRYAAGWHRDRVSLRPEEEATRRLRQTARNDLLHIDSFPNRPTHGARILRLFVNINPAEPRVWVTSETFAHLLKRVGQRVGLPGGSGLWARRLGEKLLGVFDPRRRQRSEYDTFMLRLHHYLKTDEVFQERARKRFWSFPPGSLWLAFTDALTHAELRGRHALEHSFFVPLHCLALPEESPAALLKRAADRSLFTDAA